MKIKLLPKNEQEFSKFFIFLAPLVFLLAITVNLVRDFYFLFSDALPHTRIFNYGVLDKISNQASYNLLLVFIFIFSTVYLLSKSIGRKLILFPLFFLSCLGILGLESLEILLAFIFPNNLMLLGNSTFLILFKLIIMVGLLGLVFINLLAKKEAALFVSSQFLVGSMMFYSLSLFVYQGNYDVVADNFFINSLYISSHIYVGFSFVFLSILFFLITKGMNGTLYSKTLSSITFWGYMFLLPWTNYKFHYGSVLPNWIENVSLYLSLGLLIPLLSLLVNYQKTVSTRQVENDLTYELVNASFAVFFITNIFQVVSSFSNLIPILSSTSFETAIRYGYVYSLILIVVPFVYYLIPRIFGREILFTRMESASSFLLRSVIPLTLFINGLIGINSGYSWNAGANAGNPTIYGEGYLITWSLVGTPHTVNLFLSLLLLVSIFLFAITTIRAISSGPITEIESVELVEEASNE
tara:strand:+ start:415 stop:1818 length:1404 start_codon:yes stop_codon:yes gene_type:complete